MMKDRMRDSIRCAFMAALRVAGSALLGYFVITDPVRTTALACVCIAIVVIAVAVRVTR